MNTVTDTVANKQLRRFQFLRDKNAEMLLRMVIHA